MFDYLQDAMPDNVSNINIVFEFANLQCLRKNVSIFSCGPGITDSKYLLILRLDTFRILHQQLQRIFYNKTGVRGIS